MRRIDCLILGMAMVGVACGRDSNSSDAETGSGSEAESETGSGSGSDSDSDSGSVSEADSDSDSEAEADSDSEADSESTGEEWLDSCPVVMDPIMQGSVGEPELVEASGMVHSRGQAVLWAHNDSGDSARVFGLGLDAQPIAIVTLTGASASDWEDLAIGPGPSASDWLYVGDIGDNAEARPSISVVRFEEPADIANLGNSIIVADWEALVLTYPDGPHNAETLLVDPITGDLFIVSKGAETRLFRRAAPLSSGEFEELAPPNFPSATATAGDISAIGDFIAVRGYGQAFGWVRTMGQTVGEAMLGEPCPLPLAAEMQGEIIAFESSGAGYFTLSEDANQPVWWYSYR